MKTIASRSLVSSLFILVAALFSPCTWANESPATEKSAPEVAAERKADLLLWQRSGAAALFDAINYDSSLTEQYHNAQERYSQWRKGPEFDAEMKKLGFTKVPAKAD